jgi:hypothetical protein
VSPDEAVEAGLYAWGFSSQNIDERRELLKHILEAAAPHLLAEHLLALAADTKIRGDIGKDEGVEAWDYLTSKANLLRGAK